MRLPYLTAGQERRHASAMNHALDELGNELGLVR